VDTETDAFGRYEIGALPDGDYYVKANPVYAQPYVDQYYDHSNGPINADLVTIANGENTLGISFDLYSGSYIEGDVKDSESQQPIPDIAIKAYNSAGDKMRIDTESNADGHYILGAYRFGDYNVLADPSYPDGYMDQYYPDAYSKAEAVSVAIPDSKPVTGIDFNLPAGSYIRGNVSSATGPLPDIKMKFYDSDFYLYEMTTSLSKGSGDYLSGCLKPGNYFVKAVAIYPQPYIDVYYPKAVEPEDANPVAVTLAGETTGIDFSLDPGGYLLGTVRNAATGDPLPDLDMDLYSGNWEWVDYSDHTNTSGAFLLGALPFGEYYLRCDPSLHQGFIPEFFDNEFWPADAHIITLTDTSDVENLDFDLSPGGKISGRITDAVQEIPVDNIPVYPRSVHRQLGKSSAASSGFRE